MPAPRIDRLDSYQNLIINGGMDFWQRNTTFTAVATDAYTADRFQYGKGGAIVHTISRSTDVPTVAQSGFRSLYSLLATVTTNVPSPSGSDYTHITYKMEGQDYAGIHAQSVRLQFWVKSSITGTGSVSFRNGSTNRSYIATYTILAANTWERKTIDLTMDSAGTWAFDNTNGVTIGFALMAAATFQTSTIGSWQNGNFLSANTQTNFVATNGATFQLAQVMLVQGSFPAATSLSFKRAGRTIGDELRMCQRYYEKSSDGNNDISSGDYSTSAFTGANTRQYVAYKVAKRSNATISTRSDTTLTTGVSSLAYSVNSVNNFTDGSIANNRDSGFIFALPSANSTQFARFGWAADAEL